MHTKGPKEDPLLDLGYEVRDIDTKTIEKAVMWFFGFATLMFIVGAWVYANINPAFSPKYQAEKEHLVIPPPPNPLLQTNSTNVTDIMHLRQHETAVLTSTGYTDASHAFAHIPIDRAIDILAQRGLPVVGSNTPAVSKGNTTDERKDSAPAGAATAPLTRSDLGINNTMTTPPASSAPKKP